MYARFPRVNKIPSPTTITPHTILPDKYKPPTVEYHIYNLRQRPSKFDTEITNRYALATNIINAGEENAVVHPDTEKSQEYDHLIKGIDKMK